MWKLEVLKDSDAAGWRWRLVLRNVLIVFESDCFPRQKDAHAAAEEARAQIGKVAIALV